MPWFDSLTHVFRTINYTKIQVQILVVHTAINSFTLLKEALYVFINNLKQTAKVKNKAKTQVISHLFTIIGFFTKSNADIED